ncbi:Flavone 3'-O-methyltransferase 1 [Citrus sinensis]|nr:Flavone 3'-O-methyltransferase 1 [Citrus sinensis]
MDSIVDGERDQSFAYADQLATGVVLPMAIQAVYELGIFEILDKAGPGTKLSASDIAAQLLTKNKDAPMMLDRILRLLASYSVVECSLDASGARRLYSLNSVSKYYVPNKDGVLLGPLIQIIQDKVILESWSQLKDAILEGGIPFNRAHGVHIFEYAGLNPRFNKHFNAAMYNYTSLVMSNILESYKGFDNIKQLVDVGGSLGVTLQAITTKYPYIKGINFDQPHVIDHAPPHPRMIINLMLYIRVLVRTLHYYTICGIEHVRGDMFQSVPKGDAIFMKSVLHDWNDEHCLKLLKNCYKSIPEDGKVIVVESMLPEVPNTSIESKSNSHFDVLMMIQSPGGKERTRHEFMTLATGAGFGGISCELAIALYFTLRRKGAWDGLILNGAMCGISQKFKPPWPFEHLLFTVVWLVASWRVGPTHGSLPMVSFKEEWKRKLALSSPRRSVPRLRAATVLELLRVSRDLQGI